MQRHQEAFARWERRWIAEQSNSFESNLKIFSALWEEWRSLRGETPLNPLDGLAEKIRFIKDLHV